MKLTFQVPDIITDNTVSEALVELITKASSSLNLSGSLLVSQGNGSYELYTLSDLTSSLLHSITVSSPLSNSSTDPLRPNIRIGSIIPVVSGGTGTGSLIPGTLLLAETANSFKVLSGSNGTPNYAIIWDTGSNSYIMGKGGIDVEPTLEGQLLISSGSKFVANRLTAGTNIGIINGSGSITITASVPAAVLDISASTNLVKAGTSQYPTMSLASDISVTNITASHIYVQGTASIGVLNYVSGSQVNFGDKYLVILSGATDHASLDGSGIQWGSGSTGPDTYDDLGSHAHIRFISSSNSLEIYPRLTTENVTASYISGGYIESTYFSGSYYGDGSHLSGVVASSIEDAAKYALTGSQNTFTTDQTVSGTLYVSSSVSASSFSGSADGLFITASQITNLKEYIHGNITGSGSITISATGTASLNSDVSISTLTASTHVSASKYYGDGSSLSGIITEMSTSGNITGSGTPSNPISLKDSVMLTGDLTASYITASNITASGVVQASYLHGNGANITSLNLSHVSGVLTTDHGGTGLNSFTTGALYIATTTSTLTAFTGSDFQLIAWDSAAGRWQSYSQPYDIAVDVYGGVVAGGIVLKYTTPRNLTISSISASAGLVSSDFTFKIDNVTRATPVTASAGQLLTLSSNDNRSDFSITIVASLR
jgi:hypothetical protein